MSAPSATEYDPIETTDTEPFDDQPESNVFTDLPPELIEALRVQGIVTPTPVSASMR